MFEFITHLEPSYRKVTFWRATILLNIELQKILLITHFHIVFHSIIKKIKNKKKKDIFKTRSKEGLKLNYYHDIRKNLLHIKSFVTQLILTNCLYKKTIVSNTLPQPNYWVKKLQGIA